VLDELRMRINDFNAEDPSGGNGDDENDHHQKNKIMFTVGGKGILEGAAKEKKGMSQDPVYEQLGFKSNLKYGPRSKLRKACTRFLRFSYLLDFVALEALSNIFVESVKDTVLKLRDLAAIKPEFELK